MKVNLKTARIFNDDTRTSYINVDLTGVLGRVIYNSIPDTPITRSLAERLKNEEIDLSVEEIKALRGVMEAGILPRAVNDAIVIALNEDKLRERIGDDCKMENVAKAMSEILRELGQGG